ncbi:MAG: hypothetical protein AAGJ93_01065, partial [Bacteroidota bacterium]
MIYNAVKLSVSFLLLAVLSLSPVITQAQSTADTVDVFDYTNPQEFEIGGIQVSGAYFSDENAVIGVSGLAVG